MGSLCDDVERNLHTVMLISYDIIRESGVFIRKMIYDDLCECLLDTTSGIYQAVHWVAEHYKSGTPITLLNGHIPKPKNAKSRKVWKKRLLYYYKRPSLYVAACSCTALPKTSETAAGSDTFPNFFPI